MIWNTITVWLTAFGVLSGLVGFFFIVARSTLLFGVIAVATFVLPTAAAICGFKAAGGRASLTASVIVASVVGILLLIFITDRFTIFNIDILISFAPLFATFVGFGTGRLLIAAESINKVAYCGAVVLAIFISVVFIYLLGAFQSRMPYLAPPKELFFNRPANSIAGFNILTKENTSRLYKDDAIYTGEIISYKERLTIDFISKSVSGISYYIDGLSFGSSGDILLPGHYSRWHGSTQVTDFWSFNDYYGKGQKFLLHKDYQSLFEREFPAGAAIDYTEIAAADDAVYNPNPLPDVTVTFKEKDRTVRKQVSFYYNGVAKWIETFADEGNGFQQKDIVLFDELGRMNTYDENTTVRKEDFILTDYIAYDTLKAIAAKTLHQ